MVTYVAVAEPFVAVICVMKLRKEPPGAPRTDIAVVPVMMEVV